MAKVFVASSTESRPIAAAIQETLSEHDVTVWDQDVFKLSTYPLEALESELDRAEFAVFVLAPNDVILMRGKQESVVRDNVLIELGMFIGRLGRLRCFIVSPQGVDLRLPTDLAGLTVAQYCASKENIIAALGPTCNQLRRSIEQAPIRRDVPAIARSAETLPFDDNDLLAILKDYVNNSHKMLHVYTDVDRELNLPEGSAKRLLVQAASEWLDVDVQGQSTVRFKYKDESNDIQRDTWYDAQF